jgi:hypothetical protein
MVLDFKPGFLPRVQLLGDILYRCNITRDCRELVLKNPQDCKDRASWNVQETCGKGLALESRTTMAFNCR